MAAEFRFECKFCNAPIHAPREAGGRKMKCPHCKNPVSIPVVEFYEEGEAPPPQKMKKKKNQSPAATATKSKMQRKRPQERPIQVRHKGAFVKSMIKWGILIAAIYFGYQAYLHVQKQSDKSIEQLFAELASGEAEDELLIKKIITDKVTESDFRTLREYSSSVRAEVRELVATCLSQLNTKEVPEAYDILSRYLREDKSSAVRITTAEALANIKKRKTVDFLIERLEKESDPEVRGAIARSLRNMTGERGNSTNVDRWKTWWQRSRKNYNFPEY